MRAYLIFLPSLLTGVIGAVGLWFHGQRFDQAALAWPWQLLSGTVAAAALLAGAWWLERHLASFRYASRLLERSLMHLRLRLPTVFAAAALSSLAEEIFFRGALMPYLGLWGQALVFAAMHPAPKRAWSYPAYTFVAGVVFGALTLYSHSLWPAILAHFLVNTHGFYEMWCRQQQQSLRQAPQEAAAQEASAVED